MKTEFYPILSHESRRFTLLLAGIKQQQGLHFDPLARFVVGRLYK